MRIGVDIDAVLNYRQQFVITYGTKYCAETGKGKLINLNSHHLRDMYGWDAETQDDFWHKYGKYQMIECPAVAFAPEVIQKLRSAGHEVWIVTGRSNANDRIDGMLDHMSWEDTTKDWLARNNIQYDGFGFSLDGAAPNDKGTFCREHQIAVMVEDLPEFIATFDDSTKVLIYNQPYNQNVQKKNSERVYSWYDVYSKILKMEQ